MARSYTGGGSRLHVGWLDVDHSRLSWYQVWTIGHNRGLIDQGHMAVDASDGVHVLHSHLPDAQADDFELRRRPHQAPILSLFREASGTRSRNAMMFPAQAAFRGKLAIAASGNVYAVLPDMRLAAASAARVFNPWSLPASSDAGKYFSDPLIDSARLASEDELSIFYPRKNSSDIYVLDYRIH